MLSTSNRKKPRSDWFLKKKEDNSTVSKEDGDRDYPEEDSFSCLTLARTFKKAYMMHHAIVDVWANFKQEELEV